MRPYLAIIKDSFRAAMASRVLYVLLLLITFLLIGLAPLHLRETLDWKLQMQANVLRPDELLTRIVERREEEKPIARIWKRLPASLQKRMLKVTQDPGESRESPAEPRPGQPPAFVEKIHIQEDLVDALNEIIESKDFYRPEDWDLLRLPPEATGLIDAGFKDLSDVRVKRLNRLLIANSVSPTISQGNATALDFYYAIWQTPFTVSITQQQFAHTLTSQLPFYFEKFVMSIGLLIAIIVTANMVPETFEPGSLNLLLSKPIYRSGLYIAKFLGGCVFIALCAGYLFIGVWLWMGLAMEVWDRAMLLSVPLYVIVFAIYFSVSAFVGLIWRSPIVAVILTLMFWAFCFAIGSVYGAVNYKMNNQEFISLLPIGDQVIATDVLHQVYSWNQANDEWTQELAADLGEQGQVAIAISSYLAPLQQEGSLPGLTDLIPTVYDSTSRQIFTSQYEFSQFFSAGSKDLFVSPAAEIRFQKRGRFPRGTLQLFKTSKGLVAATQNGLFYRFDPSSIASDGTGELTKAFQQFGPQKLIAIDSARQVAYNSQRDEFVIYHHGELTTYQLMADGLQSLASQKLELDFEPNMTAFVASAGSTIAIAFGNGKVITVDATTLGQVDSYQPESRSGVREIAGSPTGNYFAVLYRNENLWLLNRSLDRGFRKASIVGQGHVGAFAFGENDQWWVSENTDRVARYELSSGSQLDRHTPPGDWMAQIYRYGLRPFYRICPKPGEFYKVVTHLSAAGDTSSNLDVDMNKTQEASDPWLPLWSGLSFMAVMLALGCLVFQFKDY